MHLDEELLKQYLLPTRYKVYQITPQKKLEENQNFFFPKKKIIPFNIEKLKKGYKKYCLELCCGTGDFLIESAKNNLKKTCFVGLDYALACIQRVIKKAAKEDLNNILLYSGDAVTFLEIECKHDSFDEIMVNFPDPWPKKKHAKRRIINSKNIQLIHKTLKKSGVLYTATDVSFLYEEHLKTIEKSNLFQNLLNNKDALKPPKKDYLFLSSYAKKDLFQTGKILYTKHLKK